MSVCGVVVQAPRNAGGIFNNAKSNEYTMAYNEERKKAFVVFASTYEAAVKHLSMEQMGELFFKLGEFSLYDEDVSSVNPMVDILLSQAKPVMLKAEERHERAVKNGLMGKEYGDKGGRPRKGETREEYDNRRRVSFEAKRKERENPSKPLNIDNNYNTDKNTNKEIEIDKDIKIKKDNDIEKNTDNNKNTNIEVITNNCSSNPFNPVIDNTKQGEGPKQNHISHQVPSYDSNIEMDYSKYREGLRRDENTRQGGVDGSKRSDFLSCITLDDDFDTPSVPTDESYQNDVGTIYDIIRLGDINYSQMTDEEMADAVKVDMDAAIKHYHLYGNDQRFQDHLQRAKRTYIQLHGCSEKDAKERLNRLYRQRNKEYKRTIVGGS